MEMGLACLIILNILTGQKASYQDHQKIQEAIKIVNPKCEKLAKDYQKEAKEKAEKAAKEAESKKGE